MRRIASYGLLLLAVTSGLVATGCKGGHNLVGKWTVTSDDPKAKQLQGATMEFDQGGKVLAEVKLNQQVEMTLNIIGNYTTTADTVTLKFTDITIKTANPAFQAVADKQIAQGKADELKKINEGSPVSQLKWTSEDQVVMTDSKGIASTLTRIKS